MVIFKITKQDGILLPDEWLWIFIACTVNNCLSNADSSWWGRNNWLPLAHPIFIIYQQNTPPAINMASPARFSTSSSRVAAVSYLFSRGRLDDTVEYQPPTNARNTFALSSVFWSAETLHPLNQRHICNAIVHHMQDHTSWTVIRN